MIELAGIVAAAFGIGLSGAMMPGPVTSVTLANVGHKGTKAGPLVTLGHAIVEGLLVLALALGAGSFLADARVTGVIAIVGAFVLVWMGKGMIAESRRNTAAVGEGAVESSRMPRPIVGGMLASVANPYWYVWWATVGFSSVAVVQRWGGLGVAAFFGGHIMADLVWLTLLAGALHHGRKLMTARVYNGIIAALGLFLLVFSGLFLYFGITRFV